MIILRILPVVAVAEPFCLFPEMDINRFEVMCMRKQFRIKMKSKRGFTLAETLLAVLILLMVSAIVASGIPAAKNAYEKVVLASNAEVLLSTTITTLRNELGTAQDVKKPDAKSGETENTVITYYNPTRGASSKLYVASGSENNQKIMFQRYFSADGLIKNYDAAPLVSSKTATQDLYVTYTSVTYDKGIVTFSGLSVNRTSGTEGLASRDALSIRVISYKDD